MKTFIVKNKTCKLGENAVDNWKLFSKAGNKDIFFHLTSFSSGYVILECDGFVDKDMIKASAEICKAGTKYRNLKDIKVDYCFCCNVIKGEIIGEVIFKSRRKVKHITV